VNNRTPIKASLMNQIRAEIKSFSSPDVEVFAWIPTSREDVYFLLEIEIGETGQKLCDLFQVMVVTPEGLRKRATPSSPILSKRATLVVSELNWNNLKTELENVVRECEASTWVETVLRLQRYFQWEYENYQP
jgi:hypothetical protein